MVENNKMENWREVKKVELHRHLEGSIRLQTIFDSAVELGFKLPEHNLLKFREIVCVLEPMKDLATVLNKMTFAQSILATPGIIEKVAYEACHDAFNEGIRVLELRYSPGFVSLGHKNLSYEKIHEAILRGVRRAENERSGKLAVGLIAIISRDQGFEEAARTADFVLGNKDTFVGFDLAGDEKVFEIDTFKKYFDQMRKSGLGVTVHSGEVPGAAQHVREAIEKLGAQRIGHGVAIHDDPTVIDFVKTRNVVLEVCPTSNVYTCVADSVKTHPITKLIKAGVKVTVNSDDPQLFGITLSHEYEALASELNFSLNDFEKLNQEALQATFIPRDKAQFAFSDSSK